MVLFQEQFFDDPQGESQTGYVQNRLKRIRRPLNPEDQQRPRKKQRTDTGTHMQNCGRYTLFHILWRSISMVLMYVWSCLNMTDKTSRICLFLGLSYSYFIQLTLSSLFSGKYVYHYLYADNTQLFISFTASDSPTGCLPISYHLINLNLSFYSLVCLLSLLKSCFLTIRDHRQNYIWLFYSIH
jgi:hypothetical protein